ncbi:hypothetical protein RDABS01_012571 [Bienertia sinuspersici]
MVGCRCQRPGKEKKGATCNQGQIYE